MISAKIVSRPKCPWYNSTLCDEKKRRRKLERLWRRTKLEIHKQMYKEQCIRVINLIMKTKKQYYTKKVIECKGDCKKLFSITKRLLTGTVASAKHHSNQCLDSDLANSFNTYFITKVHTIRKASSDEKRCEAVENREFYADIEFSGDRLDCFSSTSVDEVKTLVLHMRSKTCDLDPLPTWMLKECLPDLISIITRIINLSFLEDTVPDCFKRAVVTPLLKKPNLEEDHMQNYRPISQLPFVSKVIEKVVSNRIVDHLVQHELYDNNQSAYRASHSTETSLLRVHASTRTS